MKISIIFVLCALISSNAKPTTTEFPDAISSTVEAANSTEEEISTTEMTTLEPDSVNANSTEEADGPIPPEFPVDLLSEDFLLDPNVVLARVTRDLRRLENAPVPSSLTDSTDARYDDEIPTFYFVEFIRAPRSSRRSRSSAEDDPLSSVDDPNKVLGRIRRNLDTAEDGFIIRPLFKYRHEQYERSNSQGYRNRDLYSFYDRRYPSSQGR